MMVIALARNWWALVLRGVVDVLFGIMAFAWPGITLTALVLLYGAFAITDGVFALAAVLIGRPQGMPWWALLIEGILGVAAGLVTFFWPGITALALLCIVAAWSVATGVMEITAAIRLREEIRGEWLLALAGVLSVLFGVALVINPAAGELALVWLIGAYAIAFGALFIVLGLRLRSWLKQEIKVAVPPTPGPKPVFPGSANVAR
jgi:uncharacterized membrane protein HdeD (DUF308 family)